jgi:hypothetical protein
MIFNSLKLYVGSLAQKAKRAPLKFRDLMNARASFLPVGNRDELAARPIPAEIDGLMRSGFDVPPRRDLQLTVVVPVYNERETLPRILRAVPTARCISITIWLIAPFPPCSMSCSTRR